MFVETKEAGEIQKTKVLKPSEAIRRGKPLVDENSSWFRTCAVGCAFAGVVGRAMTEEEQSQFNKADSNAGVARAIFISLGFAPEVGERVHDMHYWERMPALEIADALAALGL